MRTVKEVSKLTGVSVRTLHYYDEIGLLKPMRSSEAGYRLYDDKALELLQQILLFREFDMPLKEIKHIMETPGFDKNLILNSQKQMLILKKARLEQMIAGIDDIMEGERRMDFEVFNKSEMEQMYDAMIGNMSDEQIESLKQEYGSIEAFREEFVKNASCEQVQKNQEKVVEWYGSKERAIKAAVNPENPQLIEHYSKRYEAVLRTLAAKVGMEVNSLEVRETIRELDFIGKQIYQMEDLKAFMLDMAEMYFDKEIQSKLDVEYGEGTTLYIAQALEAFYKE